MTNTHILKHSSINNAVFTKNSSDFIVSEIPLYEFSNSGEHLILHIRKKDMTTWDMLKHLSEVSGAKVREFGYAGLKDKDGLTVQYVSILNKYEKAFSNFTHSKIKIIDRTYHKNKIKIGHLKGNRFFVRLKKISSIDAQKLSSGLEFLKENGYPNFFGYQRFGKEQNNAQDGLKILKGELEMRNKKMRNFLISAYQSELFNKWLNERIKLSLLFENFEINELSQMLSWDKKLIQEVKNQKQFLKILKGDVLHHYPHGKAFVCEDLQEEVKRFSAHDTTLTGFLVGKRALRCEDMAKEIEDEIFGESFAYMEQMTGSRRFAWSFLEDVEYKYIEDNAWFEMSFTLQKGSYATTILDELLKQKS